MNLQLCIHVLFTTLNLCNLFIVSPLRACKFGNINLDRTKLVLHATEGLSRITRGNKGGLRRLKLSVNAPQRIRTKATAYAVNDLKQSNKHSSVVKDVDAKATLLMILILVQN